MTAITINHCRSCASTKLSPILDLGEQPLANALLDRDQLSQPEAFYPLNLLLCEDCSLVQTSVVVPSSIVFGNAYPYYSSTSEHYCLHAQQYYQWINRRKTLDQNSLVVELASNDGYLLKHFVNDNIPVLGVDPAQGPAEAASQQGIPTMQSCFTQSLADDIIMNTGKADVIIANNVIAHVEDIADFVAGMKSLLKSDGIIVVEIPYLLDLLEHHHFDVIYHEHNCYYSLMALEHLFKQRGLWINDIERQDVQGGSLRLVVSHQQGMTVPFMHLLAQEDRLALNHAEFYTDFTRRIYSYCHEFHQRVVEKHQQGKILAGFGAAAKAATLINSTSIGCNEIAYIVDSNPAKQGRYLPGSHIPIVAPEQLQQQPPDELIIFAWNLADEILTQYPQYRSMAWLPYDAKK